MILERNGFPFLKKTVSALSNSLNPRRDPWDGAGGFILSVFAAASPVPMSPTAQGGVSAGESAPTRTYVLLFVISLPQRSLGNGGTQLLKFLR